MNTYGDDIIEMIKWYICTDPYEEETKKEETQEDESESKPTTK